MQVQCPYFYYLTPAAVTAAHYAKRTPCGPWISHPRGGSCLSPDPSSPRDMAAGACTWERQPAARVVFGDRLLASGWDRSSSFDDKTGHRRDNTNQTLHNGRALAAAFAAAARPLLSPRCCGC